MGKAGRIACIFTPYVLTAASLICLIFVGLGSTNSSSSTLNKIYFLRADFSDFNTTLDSSALDKIIGLAEEYDGNVTKLFLEELEQAREKLYLKDFYDIGLWNYCYGNKTSDGDYEVTHCTKPQSEFYFDPVTVWNLNNITVDGVHAVLPSKLQDGINTYRTVAKWMFIGYCIAGGLTALELLVGLLAIFSRLGSLVTSLVSGASFIFTAAATITATALSAIIVGVFDSSLEHFGAHSSLGANMLAATWLAVVFSAGSTLFWLFSSCCCSGRSPYHGDRRGRFREKYPYNYDPVQAPYGR